MKEICEILKKHKAEPSDDLLKDLSDLIGRNYVSKKESLDEISKLKESISSLEKNSAIKIALLKSGAKSEKALDGFIDREKVSFADGTLSGLDEQLFVIKKENPYLFNDEGLDSGSLHTGISSVDENSLSDEEYYNNIFKKEK